MGDLQPRSHRRPNIGLPYIETQHGLPKFRGLWDFAFFCPILDSQSSSMLGSPSSRLRIFSQVSNLPVSETSELIGNAYLGESEWVRMNSEYEWMNEMLNLVEMERRGKKQISRTEAESQQIVAQRPLSCVQYLVLYLSRLQRICLSRYLNLCFSIVCTSTFMSSTVPSQCYDLGRPKGLYLLMITSGKATYRRFPAWILA